MQSLMQIHLHRLKFFGYHGVHEEEKVLGGEFEVSLIAEYLPQQLPITDISQTVDYTALFGIIKTRMQRPTELLETIATEVCSEIIAKFETVRNVAITINKLHPPIVKFEGSVGVTFSLKRD